LLTGQLIGPPAFSTALALVIVSRRTRTQSRGLNEQKFVYRVTRHSKSSVYEQPCKSDEDQSVDVEKTGLTEIVKNVIKTAAFSVYSTCAVNLLDAKYRACSVIGADVFFPSDQFRLWHGTNDNRANVVAVATVGRTMHTQLGAELMKPSAMIESEMSPPLLLHALRTRRSHVYCARLKSSTTIALTYYANRSYTCQFLPRDATLARSLLSSCVRPSVCPSQAGIVSKRLDESSWVLAWRLLPPIPHGVVMKFGYFQNLRVLHAL